MQFMNEYDVEVAKSRFSRTYATPNRFAAALTVEALMEWANENSDGWAYWPKPVRAAAKTMALIASTTSAENEARERTDATEAELKAAYAPIKAFFTRFGQPERAAEVLHFVSVEEG